MSTLLLFTVTVVFTEPRYSYNKKNIKLKISTLHAGVFAGIDIIKTILVRLNYRNSKCQNKII